MNNQKFTNEDDLLLAELLSDAPKIQNDITKLVHVKPRAKADLVAQREVCNDFGLYKSLFEQVQGCLNNKSLIPIPYKSKRDLNLHGFYIVNGQKAFIVEFGERLRVIFDNGTECRLLFRSFQKSLVSDKTSMVIC